jgi:hypothetical protein
MKRIIIFLLMSLFFSSCQLYKIGQTPDDIYFSAGDVYQKKEKISDEYQNYISSSDDAYLRMRIKNRTRWSQIDNFSYWNDIRFNFFPYTYNYWMMSSLQNNWFLWGNSFHNNWFYCWGNPFFSNNWYYHFGNPYFTNNWFLSPMNNQGNFMRLVKTRASNNQSFINLISFRNKSYNNSNNSFLGRSDLNRTISTPNSSWSVPSRSFDSSPGTAPSRNAGGLSGGFNSVGSSAGSSRGGRN